MQKLVCEIPRWRLLKAMLKNLKEEAFFELYNATPNAILLDVRTFEEFDKGHLTEAIHLDYLGPEFIDQLDEMDKNAPYFIYCQSCRRSTRSCTLLRNSGFKHIYNLEGGLNEMKKKF